MLGKVELRRANDAAELEKVHATFLSPARRAIRPMGVTNIFASDHFVRFFKTLAARSFNSDRPRHGLPRAYAGDESSRLLRGVRRSHYSQYIIPPPAARPPSTSSGRADRELCDELNRVGIVSHDMGVGDFEYKRLDRAAGDHTTRHPVTAKGMLICRCEAWHDVRRTIKQNRRLWALAQGVLKARYEG